MIILQLAESSLLCFHSQNRNFNDPSQKRADIFKDIFLRTQDLSITTCKKSSKGGRRQVWVCQYILTKLKHTHTKKCIVSKGRDIHFGKIVWIKPRIVGIRLGSEGIARAKLG